jgi:hypothetical protein
VNKSCKCNQKKARTARSLLQQDAKEQRGHTKTHMHAGKLRPNNVLNCLKLSRGLLQQLGAKSCINKARNDARHATPTHADSFGGLGGGVAVLILIWKSAPGFGVGVFLAGPHERRQIRCSTSSRKNFVICA